MRSHLFCLAVLGVLALGSGTAGSAPTPTPPLPIAQKARESRHLDLEQLFSTGQYQEGIRVSEARLAESPQDPELYVHLFRFLFEKGEHQARDQKGFDKEAHYLRMLELVDKGLVLAPSHPRLLWGKGVATARLGTTRGVLASLMSAKDIEQTWLTVTKSEYRYESLQQEEMLPCDTYLALGIFYRLVPDWWIVKAIAGTRGDLDRALAMVQKSEQCAPGRIRSVKELGIVHFCLATRRDDEGHRQKGMAAMKRALAIEADRPIERLDQQHIKMLMQMPDKACEYSRDGFQDLDETKLKR